jgi:hypothetical protein
MFKIKAEATIPATLTIVGQGRSQTLKVQFKHKTLKERQALQDRLLAGEVSVNEVLLEVVESWEAEEPLNMETLDLLQDEQPGANMAILSAYGEAHEVAREKN